MQDCPSCRQRVLTSDDVGLLLRSTYMSPRSQPNAEQMTNQIMARIEAHRAGQPLTRPARPSLLQRASTAAYLQPILVVIIAVGLIAAFSVPTETWAGFPLARMIGFDGVEPDGSSTSRGASDSTISQAPLTESTALTFEPFILETLPGGFTLTEQLATSPSRVALTYERADGLEIWIVEVPGNDARTAIDRKRYDLDRVDDTDVLFNLTGAYQSVSSAIWAHDDRLFSLYVQHETADVHLDRDTALTIIHSIGY